MNVPVVNAAVVAAAAAGSALSLWVQTPRLLMGPDFSRLRGLGAVGIAGLTTLALTQLLHGSRLVLGLIGLGAALTVRHLVQVSHREAEADRLADLVLGVCEGMAADLMAGQAPTAALTRAASEWPPLSAAASAARLGGDVPMTMRALAQRPGAEALRSVAAAWQVSHRSGSGLALALTQSVSALRERRRTTHMVAAELASARATAHILTVLPFGVLLLGNGVGGDPFDFLLNNPVGLGCLGVGTALALLGQFWLQRISAGVLAR